MAKLSRFLRELRFPLPEFPDMPNIVHLWGKIRNMEPINTVSIQKVRLGQPRQILSDQVIAEAPLEIMIGYSASGKRHRAPVAATMRTPGDDFNLVAGWLFAEGIIGNNADLMQLKYAGDTDTVLAELAPHVAYDPEAHRRQFPISSACGWCGRYANRGEAPNVLSGDLRISPAYICALPELLRAGQGLFSATGGAHAAALVDEQGRLLLRCEDVGRHNALDKLVGAMLRAGALPLNRHAVIFSGRFGYELAQKALAAGIQLVCSIGAPSSAALELADAYGMTVCGFVREQGFNLYCGGERIAP